MQFIPFTELAQLEHPNTSGLPCTISISAVGVPASRMSSIVSPSGETPRTLTLSSFSSMAVILTVVLAMPPPPLLLSKVGCHPNLKVPYNPPHCFTPFAFNHSSKSPDGGSRNVMVRYDWSVHTSVPSL